MAFRGVPGRAAAAKVEHRVTVGARMRCSAVAMHALPPARKGMHETAISESRKAVDLAPDNVGILSDLGYVYAVCGRRADARKIIEELGHQAARRPVSSHYIACIYAGLGEKGLAMEWLEKAYQENSQWLVHIKLDPQLEILRGDPRFADLLRRIGF